MTRARCQLCFEALVVAAAVVGCGATQSGTSTTPARRELVIDEPTIVQGRPTRAPGELPALPQPLDSSPEAFRRAHALAAALLAAEGPGTPPSEDAAHAQWSKDRFAPWLTRRAAELQAVVDAFAPAREGTAAERVVAAALVGLGYARLHAQLVGVPPPATVAADAKLTRVYQSALDTQAQAFLEQGSAALARCAQEAMAQTEAAFGQWLDACQEARVALVQRASQARMLAELVEAERKADLIADEGARPPGPEVCWTPELESVSVCGSATTTVRTSTAGCTTTGTAAAEWRTSASPRSTTDATLATTAPATTDVATAAPPARHCARDATARVAASVREPAPTPRELRYGFRDAATSVRVSAALAEADTMDASPLAEPATRRALAACFAQHVRPDQAVTVALHATLVVDARGKARSATLTPEPSDDAAKPSGALVGCVQRALVRVAFDCSPSGQEAQARVTYCLRRD